MNKKKLYIVWKVQFLIYGAIFDKINSKDKLKDIENKINQSNFWEENKSAQIVLKEKNFLEKITNDTKIYQSDLKDIKDLIDLTETEIKDNDEFIKAIENNIVNLKKKIQEIELFCLLSSKTPIEGLSLDNRLGNILGVKLGSVLGSKLGEELGAKLGP